MYWVRIYCRADMWIAVSMAHKARCSHADLIYQRGSNKNGHSKKQNTRKPAYAKGCVGLYLHTRCAIGVPNLIPTRSAWAHKAHPDPTRTRSTNIGGFQQMAAANTKYAINQRILKGVQFCLHTRCAIGVPH